MKTDPNLEYFLNTHDPLAIPDRMPSSTRVVPAAYPEGYGDLSFNPQLVDQSISYDDIPRTSQGRVAEFLERARARHRELAPRPAEDARSTDRE